MSIEMLNTADVAPDLFENIARDLAEKGYSIQPNALPLELTDVLWCEVTDLGEDWFHRAGVGRQLDYQVNRFNRTDQVCWIEGTSPACRRWLSVTESLRMYLNQTLFMGLFSYESHYARYQPGDFYKRHYDAFIGQSNRRVSTVFYLNPGWGPLDGGELVLYQSSEDREGLKVTPAFGTLVCFLSEQFPHEVLPASRTRYSIAGWYRINASTSERVDPPR